MQAAIGTAVGVGLVRGLRPLGRIAMGQGLAPATGAALSAFLFLVTHLRYVG